MKNTAIGFVGFDDVKNAGPSTVDPDRAATLVVYAGEDGAMSDRTRALLGPAAPLVERAARAARFKGRAGAALELLAPHGLGWDRLIVMGVTPGKGDSAASHVALGGQTMGRIGQGARASILFDLPTPPDNLAAAAADLALGISLRAYRFDAYRTKKKDDDKPSNGEVGISVFDPAAARAASLATDAVADGVILARTLVNEPPNILFPEEFARRAQTLERFGVSVETLGKQALTELGMGALLGVAQGSVREPRVVIMRWNGGEPDEAPIAFIGKGVCFDSGGISIKPAASMEDMKGDMAGAACVTGLMQALAQRKAKVNVIGAIGLVENMPDGAAQRPGDIVRSMSGQTIEIINTDAEGRLVLADVLWHVKEAYKPKFMIDLATLTGAIMVALGQDYAGMFTNSDELAARLDQAGKETEEKVWRMPLGPAYDKMIDSKFADMKNTGGRYGGSITAAQFLQRYVGDTPWAHLDIAGTGMGSPASDVNQSWGSGWGVRLLDRLVRDHYEG